MGRGKKKTNKKRNWRKRKEKNVQNRNCESGKNKDRNSF